MLGLLQPNGCGCFCADGKNCVKIDFCLGHSFSYRVNDLCIFFNKNVLIGPATFIVAEHEDYFIVILAVELVNNRNVAAGNGFGENRVNVKTDNGINVFCETVILQRNES